jgi:hypothetical protein
MEVFIMSLNYITRSNDGQVHDHFESIESALQYFLSDDGYRLDFLFPDGRTLYIHRAEFDQDEKLGPYHVAASKVLYFDATQNHDNVIQVLFGNNNV